MLYKKLYAISLSVYAFLTSRTMGGEYFVSSNSGNPYTCNDTDRCDIYCDEENKVNGYQFNCGNASECYFHCEEKKCAEVATIRAINSDNLYVDVGKNGQECLKGANIYTPNNGNAYFTTSAKKGFKEMNVHSGNNTQSIIIDSSQGQEEKDDCKDMNIYASTADYLKIIIGDGQEFEASTVECPVDSTYNAPDIAPCIIDGANAIMTDLNIIAPDGVPHGVYIIGSTATNVHITCSNIDNKNGADGDISTFPFDTGSDCWWTNNPTNDPTTNPTNNPTPSPTTDPTPSPTEHPTDSTKNPTPSPTNNPTPSPTTNPTAEPTKQPTPAPTTNPTPTPTNNPTLKPTAYPTKQTEIPTKMPTNDPTTDPTKDPTTDPTMDPTKDPTDDPTKNPTKDPTKDPTNDPTADPTKDPTSDPTNDPTKDPTTDPTVDPTTDPTKYPTKKPTEQVLSVPIGNRPTKSPTFKPTISTLETDGNSNTETAANKVENGEVLPIEVIIGVISGIFCLICTIVIAACFVRNKNKKNTNNLDGPQLETVRSNTFDTKSPKHRTFDDNKATKRCDADLETNYNIEPDEFEVVDEGHNEEMDDNDDEIMDGIHITGGADDNDHVFTDNNMSNMSYNKKEDFGRMIGDDTMVQTMVMNDILNEMEEDKQYKNSYNKDLDDDILRDMNVHTTAGGPDMDNNNDSDDDVLSDDIHITAGGPDMDNNNEYNNNNNNIIDDIINNNDEDDDILLNVNELQITEEGANDIENINDSDDEIVLHGFETVQ